MRSHGFFITFCVLFAFCGGEKEEDSMKETTAHETVPDWVVFPEQEWLTLTPEEAFPETFSSGTTPHPALTDREAWNRWVSGIQPEDEQRTAGGRPPDHINQPMKEKVKGASFQGEDHSGKKWGVAIARGGYLLQTFGDADYRFQTASLGKSFTMACLQLAIDKGLINGADDLIKNYWIGEGELNSPHKYLNQGHHNSLTFSHLANHVGGFPVTNGESWKNCNNYDRGAPPWSNCTGDPDHDNYAHAEPGTVAKSYSSGGYWRLAQALTAIWKEDLKVVMDERLLGKMGIPADRWDWTPGQTVREDSSFYPEMPGYGLYLDPPYEIDGQVVRGGPGWVVMSAKDLARFGLLIATGGIWKGERLISDTDLLRAHGGGNGCFVGGVGEGIMLSFSKVTTSGIDFSSIPLHLLVGNRPQPKVSSTPAR